MRPNTAQIHAHFFNAAFFLQRFQSDSGPESLLGAPAALCSGANYLELRNARRYATPMFDASKAAQKPLADRTTNFDMGRDGPIHHSRRFVGEDRRLSRKN
jgi:hypothetical protein